MATTSIEQVFESIFHRVFRTEQAYGLKLQKKKKKGKKKIKNFVHVKY